MKGTLKLKTIPIRWHHLLTNFCLTHANSTFGEISFIHSFIHPFIYSCLYDFCEQNLKLQENVNNSLEPRAEFWIAFARLRYGFFGATDALH